MKKRLAAVLLSVLICVPLSAGVYAEDLPDMTALETAAPVDNSLPAKSAILIEQESGRVLFEKNADEVLPPGVDHQGDDAAARHGGARRGAHLNRRHGDLLGTRRIDGRQPDLVQGRRTDDGRRPFEGDRDFERQRRVGGAGGDDRRQRGGVRRPDERARPAA